MASVNFANANSGPLAAAIGWFDFTGVTLAPNATLNLANSLPNGGNISFTITNTPNPNNITFVGHVSPERAGIPFGSTNYTGIAGMPLLDASIGNSFKANLTIDNLSVTNSQGATIPFGLVMAEAEGSVGGESWTWTTNGTPWTLIANIYGSLASISGTGTQTVTWGGANPWPSPVFYTSTPTTMTGTDLELSQSAIALGVILTQITVKKNIVNRRYPTDQFNLSIGGSTSASTVTYGSSTGLQSVQAYLVGAVGQAYTINESMASGSTGILQEYVQSVSIVNSSIGGTTIPSNWSLGTPITVAMGDNITAIITNNTLPDIKSTKTVSSTNGTFNSILTYTIALANLTSDTVVNLNFVDTIPAGTSLVSNSLTVNGVLNGGNTNPPTGITGISIVPNGVTTVSFKVLVNQSSPIISPITNNSSSVYSYLAQGVTIPVQSSNSNTVTTTITAAALSATKTTNKTYGTIGDVVTYTIVVKNSGNVAASSVVFQDTVPLGTSFVANSVTLNGATVAGGVIGSGISLGSLGSGASATITFKATITTIPTINPIQNIGTLTATYVANATTYNTGTITNAVLTQVNTIDFSGMKKNVDKAYAYPGQTITYTIVVPNSGNITGTNLIFYDTLPNGTTFVDNSITINGVVQNGLNLISGITLPNIGPGEKTTITFTVLIN